MLSHHMNPTIELQYNSILISALPNKVIKEEGKEIVVGEYDVIVRESIQMD